MNLECFVEDLFLGGQWSIILGYRRLSVKSLLVYWQRRYPGNYCFMLRLVSDDQINEMFTNDETNNENKIQKERDMLKESRTEGMKQKVKNRGIMVAVKETRQVNGERKLSLRMKK